MEIVYKSRKLEKICTNFQEAKRQYGEKNALKIHLRIDQLSVTETVDEFD